MKKKIVFFCYAAMLLSCILWVTGVFIGERIDRARGLVQTAQLSLNDVTLIDIRENGDGTLTVTGTDPQIWVSVSNGSKIRRVHITLDADVHGESALYYLKNGQAEFSAKQIVLPHFGEKRNFAYSLPFFQEYETIRIDLGSTPGDTFSVQNICINEDPPFISYWRLNLGQGCIVVVFPLVVACIWISIDEIHGEILEKKRQKGRTDETTEPDV